MGLLRDFSLSAATAGFVAVLVGFTSSVAIVFQAAQAFQATPEVITSWMWALGLGMGLCTLVPSLWLRKPVMVAWSTPGAAVLATAGLAGGFSLAEAVGAFLIAATLITLCGITGAFERVMARIPIALASALLAGVLTRFGLQAFEAAETAPGLVLLMLATYLIGRRWATRYAVVLTLAVGVAYVLARGQMAESPIQSNGPSRWSRLHSSASARSWGWPFPFSSSRWPRRTCRASQRSRQPATVGRGAYPFPAY